MLGGVGAHGRQGAGVERLGMRAVGGRLRGGIRDGVTRSEQRDGYGELGGLMLGGVGVQLRLGHGYVGADARETGLLLHAILGYRGRVGMDADGDALKAGHRVGRSAGAGTGAGKDDEEDNE